MSTAANPGPRHGTETPRGADHESTVGDRADLGDRGDRADHGDRTDRAAHSDRGDSGDHADRTDRAAHSDRGDSGDHGDRTDHGDRRSALGRDEVVAREKEAYGGIKIGSAFFGWLTATAAAVLLTALVAAAGAAVGVSTDTDPTAALNQASADPKTVGISGAVALLVILFIAYYCGGYVAGRMARFNGLKQGVAVWVWAIVIAVVVAILAAVAGSRYDILSTLNSFPRIPVDGGTLTTGGIIALVAVALASLIGALLGGLAGMRFHRKVDKAGLGA